MRNPPAKTVWPWLKANLHKGYSAALTSTDVKGLEASIGIVELYAYTRRQELIDAWVTCVEEMQLSTRWMAIHAVAHVMDWSDREHFAEALGVDMPKVKCHYEPGGGGR